MTCLDQDTAAAYLAGELDQPEADRCAAHVTECAACRELLRNASALIDEVRQDLLVLDTVLEDSEPAPVERIFERTRESVVSFDENAAANGAPPRWTDIASAGRPASEVRRSPDSSSSDAASRPRVARQALLAVAAAMVLLFLIPNGTFAWAAEKIKATFQQILARGSDEAAIDVPGGPPKAARDVVLPSVSRVPAEAPVKTIKVAPAVALSPSQLALLEMDVLARLDAVGALLEGHVTVSRTDSRVEVRGLVEDLARRRAVVDALASLPRNALSVNVRTVGEELRQVRPPSTPSIRYYPLEYDAAGIPAAADVRAHLARSGRMSGLDDEVKRIATSALRHSRAGLLHVLAMESLSERYEAQALKELNRDAYQQWIRLIAAHAKAFGSETRRLRELLEPVFVSDVSGIDSPGASDSDDGDRVNTVVPRLRRLAVNIDEVVRQGLAASTERVERVQIREREFWQGVRQAERLAEALVK